MFFSRIAERCYTPGMNAGYLTIARWHGVPLRFHWTVPLGAFLLGGMRFDPQFWLGFLVLVLVHEAGHALVVRACHRRVLAIDVHGAGGLCRWAGGASPMQRAAIAWGGVWAQMALAAGVLVFTAVHGLPDSRLGATFDEVFVDRNLWVIALNLLPFAPLDGAQAWALPGLLFQRMRGLVRAHRHERAVADPSVASLEGLAALRAATQPLDDTQSRAELARLERNDAIASDVRPEVDQLLRGIEGLGPADPQSARAGARVGGKDEPD